MSAPVFISFSHEHDAGHVSRLAARLAAAGITARCDTHPMSEGWWETYTRAQIDACQAVIAVTSPAADGSGWVARELDYARSQGKLILAIGVGEAPGPELLDRLRPAPVEAYGDGPLVPTYQGKMRFAVGIETRGGTFTPLIDENAVLPAEVTETFTTAEDNQTAIKIHAMAGDGQSLGRYELLIKRAPRYVAQIHVTLRVEVTGAFRLIAKDANGNAVPIRSPAGRASGRCSWRTRIRRRP